MSHVAVTSTVLVTLMAGAAPARAEAPLAELVRRADHALRGKTTAAVMHMQIHTSAYDRTYSMVLWEDTQGPESKVLVKILGPALWRGYGTLKVGDRLSTYTPGTDRVTVMSGSMLAESWMGSHFNNDDFVKNTDLATDYTATERKRWAGNAGGRPVVYRELELRPTPHAPVAWDHLVLELYVDGDAVVPVRFDYYRRATDRAPYRTLAFSEVKPIGGRTAPTVLTMTVADKPGESTRIVYDQARFDAAVPAAKFTDQALRQ